MRTTPVSFLPSHLTYATPQSPSGRERPLIARFLLCPLSPLQRHLCRRTRFNGHRYHQHMLLVPRNTVSLPLLAHHSRSPAHSNRLPQSLLLTATNHQFTSSLYPAVYSYQDSSLIHYFSNCSSPRGPLTEHSSSLSSVSQLSSSLSSYHQISASIIIFLQH